MFKESIQSVLQKVIDANWKKTKLYFVLCGSLVAFMKDEVLAETAPLHGRASVELKLKPFNYLDTAEFVSSYTPEEKAIVYGLTNGVAKYIEQFDDQKPLVWLPKKDPNSKVNILMLVSDKVDGHAVGIYALNHDVERDVWTISYVNRFDDWGKGYTVEGMKALMDPAVKVYGARVFEGECAKENVGSAKVMQKLGMVYDHDSSYTKSDGSATFESEVYIYKIDND